MRAASNGLTLASGRSSPLILNDLHVWCFGTSLAIRDVVGIVSLEAANPTLPWRNFTHMQTRKGRGSWRIHVISSGS
jgi:hypothetical protein